MAKVKICGLSRAADVEAVNEAMPEYIGFVFAESRRKITPMEAMALREKLAPDIVPVGVFVDERPESIIDLVRHGVIDVIQLHGAEDEAYVSKLKAMTDKPLIKAIAIQKGDETWRWADSEADFLLLDSYSGGSGRRFDWRLIGTVDKPFFLAGGLNADNIAEAIGAVRPYAADVSSGVETKGHKDRGKIIELIRRVRDER